VNCFAAGTGVVSTVTLRDTDPLPYATNGIKQTSVAAALIAGGVMMLQAYIRVRGVAPLTPDHLLALIRTDDLATKTTPGIGNMPSFEKIATRVIKEAFG